ncbi:PDZ and LIM domain protein 4-like [Babylonia areolata]|uniref:PDZ and LIM domain protein 4-like n=1 Tax=Babylonia areolata TaxID=304850 RepID=UPI003FCFE93A
MTSFAVVLRGGSPWGFRITGGREFNLPITVSKINPNSKAYNEGVKVGDVISEINGHRTHGLNYADAQQLIKNSTEQLLLQICSC